MRTYEDLKIYLLDNREDMCNAWKAALDDAEDYHQNVEVIYSDFIDFMKKESQRIDSVVSPANSYGLMDGGYDAALTMWYGTELQDTVQKEIINRYFGEQPVGTCMSVLIPTAYGQYLLHTPTMRVPSIIEEPEIVYHCTRACIMEALRLEVNNIVIPAFGGCCGKVPDKLIADYMERALYSFENVPSNLSWHWAYKTSSLGEMNPKERSY